MKTPSAGSIATATAPAQTAPGWGALPASPTPDAAGWSTLPSTPEQDGWSPGAAWTATPSFVQAPAPPAPPAAEEADGWGTMGQPIASPRPSFLQEEDEALSPLPGSRATPWAEEEPSDSWLDDDEEAPASGYDGSIGPAGRASGSAALVWLAVAAVTMLVVAGLWSLRNPSGPPKTDAKAEKAATLKLARGTVLEGQRKLQGKDGYGAAVLLEAAIPKLKAGGAGAAEVLRVRKGLAQALMADGQFEKGEAVWKELLKHAPEWKVEARAAIKRADSEMRKIANDKLEDAEGSLKSEQYRQAQTLAEEALRLYQAHEGRPEQVGQASGALGYAYLRQGKSSKAMTHLARADALYPQGRYWVALGELQDSGTIAAPAEDAPAARAEVTAPVSTSIDADNPYPTALGGPPRPAGGRDRSQPVQTEPVAQKPPAPQRKPPAAPKPRPEPERHQQDDGFKPYQNAANSGREIKR